MGRTFEGGSSVAGDRFAIAASRFNEQIVGRLVEGATTYLEAAGAQVDLAWCPGAVELPLTSSRLASSGTYAAVVAIGCVIRGGTPHFDYVAAAANDGLMRVSLDSGVPVAFGVLTCETMAQAEHRSAPLAVLEGRSAAESAKLRADTLCNKGVEAAEAAVEMVGLLRAIDDGQNNG